MAPLLPLLRYAFLAGLLVFVARVVRAVLADLEVRAVPAAAARTLLVAEQPGTMRGREFLVAGDAVIGRAPECAIMLPEQHVSTRHARVFQRGGRSWVEDLRSTNGTFLNGRRLRRPAALRPGDRLRIGDVVLGYRVEPPIEPVGVGARAGRNRARDAAGPAASAGPDDSAPRAPWRDSAGSLDASEQGGGSA